MYMQRCTVILPSKMCFRPNLRLLFASVLPSRSADKQQLCRWEGRSNLRSSIFEKLFTRREERDAQEIQFNGMRREKSTGVQDRPSRSGRKESEDIEGGGNLLKTSQCNFPEDSEVRKQLLPKTFLILSSALLLLFSS